MLLDVGERIVEVLPGLLEVLLRVILRAKRVGVGGGVSASQPRDFNLLLAN